VTTIALASARLTPITLSAGPFAPDLAPLGRGFAGTSPRHVTCRATTPAQRNVTAALIDGAVTDADRAVLLIAHGVGCAAAAWWARLSPRSYVERVAGALLIDPDADPLAAEAFASPRAPLLFPSIVLGGGDTAERLSGEWGSRLFAPPPAERPAGRSNRLRSIVLRFTTAIVEKDVGRAERLLQAVSDQ
jgi:uncharacterized protein